MKAKNVLNFVFAVCCSVVFILYFSQSIVYSKEIIAEVSNALYRIINVVFPSLFGFMVGCDFLIRSGFYSKISYVFYPVARFVFKIPQDVFFVIILSCLGGYPVGIKMLHRLVDEGAICKEDAEKMLAFCYCPSPSFAVGLVGNGVFHNPKAGFIIYFSCVTTNLIMCFILKGKMNFKNINTKKKVVFSADNLVLSITDCGVSMLKICGVIVFFSYITTLLDCMNFFEILKIKSSDVLLKSVFEITNITALSPSYNLLPLISVIFSTGGGSILLQMISINAKKISLKKFFLFRIPVGIIAGAITSVILRVFPMDLACNYEYMLHQNRSGYSILSSICILFMIIIIFFQKKTSILKKSVL